MSKINLEKFEENFQNEINTIRSLKFRSEKMREFKYPAYQFVYRKALAFAFAMPAFAFVFAFFFYTGQNSSDNNLAMLEDSNQRILNQINLLEE